MKGDFIDLVTSTIKEALQNAEPHDKTNFDTKTHILNSLLLSGWIHKAVCYVTNQNNERKVQPDDTDEKAGCLL